MSTTRQHLSSAVVDKKPYTLSEEEEEEGKEEKSSNVDVNEMYDPKLDSWTTLQPMCHLQDMF